MKAQGLVHWLGTHESQKAPKETQTEALDFMGVICLKLQLQCQSKAFILNMDQTPIPFTFNSKSTLDVVGARTVHVHKSTNDTKQATAAITITASGKMLPPLLVFKGAKNGRIVKKEFPTFDKSMYYACQENAWMDEQVMLLWVEKVLKPYVESAPEGIVPLLLLDSYHYHVMASVVNEIQDLGVEVEHIPGSCTYLCQPVDIGINKPYKKHMRQQWELWMISEGMVEGTTSPPSREQIVNWAKYANETMSEVNICNAWKHGQYSWFPNEVQED